MTPWSPAYTAQQAVMLVLWGFGLLMAWLTVREWKKTKAPRARGCVKRKVRVSK